MLIPVAVVSSGTAEPSVVAPAVSGYDLWLDASDPATVTLDGSGLLASTWADKSGNSYTATATGSIPYVRTRLNSRQMMMMMGAQHFTAAGAQWAADATSSAFFVGNMWALTNYRTLLHGSAATTFQWVFATSVLELYLSGVSGIASKSNGGITEAVPFIAGVRVSAATTQYLKTRGASVTQETDGAASTNASPDLLIGKSVGSPFYFQGLIGEVITYPTTLSDADTLSVISGLSTKWDI